MSHMSSTCRFGADEPSPSSSRPANTVQHLTVIPDPFQLSHLQKQNCCRPQSSCAAAALLAQTPACSPPPAGLPVTKYFQQAEQREGTAFALKTAQHFQPSKATLTEVTLLPCLFQMNRTHVSRGLCKHLQKTSSNARPRSKQPDFQVCSCSPSPPLSQHWENELAKTRTFQNHYPENQAFWFSPLCSLKQQVSNPGQAVDSTQWGKCGVECAASERR